MPALLATLHDLAVGLVIGIVAAGGITGLGALIGKSIHGAQEIPPRLPVQRATPVDFDGEISAYKNRRDEEVMGERRVA